MSRPNHCQVKVHCIHTNRAYDTSTWRDYCQCHGIIHELTTPYSSAQNGLAERAICTTIDNIRTLLWDSDLSHSYWAEATSYSVHTHNLIPSRHYPARIPLEFLQMSLIFRSLAPNAGLKFQSSMVYK